MNIKLTPEQTIEALISELGLKYEKEFYFNHGTKHRFDYRIIDPSKPDLKLAIEIEGGNWGGAVVCNHCKKTVMRRLKSNGKMVPVREGGRHNTGQGFEDDCEKYNIANCLGWTVLRYTTNQIQKYPSIIEKQLRFAKERSK